MPTGQPRCAVLSRRVTPSASERRPSRNPGRRATDGKRAVVKASFLASDAAVLRACNFTSRAYWALTRLSASTQARTSHSGDIMRGGSLAGNMRKAAHKVSAGRICSCYMRKQIGLPWICLAFNLSLCPILDAHIPRRTTPHPCSPSCSPCHPPALKTSPLQVPRLSW